MAETAYRVWKGLEAFKGLKLGKARKERANIQWALSAAAGGPSGSAVWGSILAFKNEPKKVTFFADFWV